MLATVAALAAGGALAKSKDEKLCTDLKDFRANVTSLEQMGPQSTVKDLQMTAGRLDTAGQRIVKEAKRDKHASALHDALGNLERAVNGLAPDETLADAEASISDEVSATKNAAREFSQTYCVSEQ
jgi:hypothetical protein